LKVTRQKFTKEFENLANKFWMKKASKVHRTNKENSKKYSNAPAERILLFEKARLMTVKKKV